MTKLLSGLVLTILICTGCQRDKVVFEAVQEIADATWAYGDQYGFSFNVDDTTGTYRLLVEITHTTDYAWENFYATILTSFPGDSVKHNVISFELASKLGAWYGKCNRQSCTVSIPLQDAVRFTTPGRYRISFEQHMREERLRGIERLKLTLVRLVES